MMYIVKQRRQNLQQLKQIFREKKCMKHVVEFTIHTQLGRSKQFKSIKPSSLKKWYIAISNKL